MRSLTIRNEEGAVAITTALILIVLILLAAFLIDLGSTRADARTDQLLADSAVLAGASAEGEDIHEQCSVALEYFAANIGAGAPDTTGCENDLPSSCDPDSPPPPTPTREIDIGPYTVVVWHPVADDDDAMTVEGQGISDRDGDLCDRMKIVVSRDRAFTFAPAGGASSSGSSVNDAVALREIEAGSKEFATLIVLDRSDCGVLTVAGGSAALVEDLGPERPGLVAVDSHATESPACDGDGDGKFAIVPGGADTRICAGLEDEDATNAVLAGDPCPEDSVDGAPRIYSPSNERDKTAKQGDLDDGLVGPTPLGTDDEVTRAPADHQWNCLDAYGTATASQPWLPVESDIAGCEEGHDPYIQLMAEQVADSSDKSFSLNGPWNLTYSGKKCTLGDGVVGSLVENIYFDCDKVEITGDVEIRTKDYIVVRGDLEVSDQLTVDTGEDVVLAFQDGGLLTPGSPEQVSLTRTAVYVHQQTFSGSQHAINVNLSGSCLEGGGAPCADYPVEWTAPDGPAHDIDEDGDGVPETIGQCETLALEKLPSPECFEDMGLWTNADDDHILKGLMDVRGVFFTPNAGREKNRSFDLSGGATQPMRRAQFFSYKLEITGGSKVLMRPDPDSILPTHEITATLIR